MTIVTIMTKADDAAWTVADAKAHLSEVIQRARADGPQTITRNGKPAVVVVGVEEWARKSRRSGSLAEFLAASPLPGSGLSVTREKDDPRAADL